MVSLASSTRTIASSTAGRHRLPCGRLDARERPLERRDPPRQLRRPDTLTLARCPSGRRVACLRRPAIQFAWSGFNCFARSKTICAE
jgi:hypothetical protein